MSNSFLQRLSGRWRYLISLPTFQHAPLRTLCRTFAWRLLCWCKIPGKVSIKKWDARFSLNPEWHGAGATLFYVVREEYEPEVTFLEKLVRPGDLFVDAGANCGVYTVAAAHFVGQTGRVLAFEPGEGSLGMLRRNVALNHFEHISIFPVALSDKTGTARLYTHGHGASSFTLGPNQGEAFFTIETVTLDSILAKESIERVDIVKMDVEGAEELILRGAVELFSRCQPKVIFEVNPDAAARLGLSGQGAWDFLAARGYRFYAMQTNGTIQGIDAPTSANTIALHPAAHALPDEGNAVRANRN